MIRIYCISLLLLILLQACRNDVNTAYNEDNNEKTVESYVTTVWNNKDLSGIEVFFSKEFSRRINNVEIATNKKELAAHIQVYFNGFPDLHLTVNKISSLQNQIFINWTIKGTNTGVFGELPVTGKKITVSGISRFDMNENGEIVFEDIFYNELSFLQQLGYNLSPPKVE